ncbi:Para-aminobenzoate synthase, aminase component [hydrothermal vent metagenome]|uniref:Para-aminobenzoate synthase, aminase component n=1 Tax=hydrothermal vent metagenome TaxID=652676 RepID=A0A1W1C5V8_9ZZZZ
MNHIDGIEKINSLGRDRVPFLFILSYDKSEIYAQPLEELDDDIYYKIRSKRNYASKSIREEYSFVRNSIPFEDYKRSLERVVEQIKSGNTYLLNLTFETHIESSLSLIDIFRYAQADYKLYFKDKFICFSPERFVEIAGDTISTYPMKGTIEASIPDAKEKILSNPKEMAEHIMIVDLMRNDLGIVARDVKVERFRYVDQIKAGDKELLQVSSKITATMPDNWRDSIGDTLDHLTPAGSITGTPKRKTIEIIDDIESHDRGFYTGIFGIFDGSSLYSSVMIRYIECRDGELYYKSGGGITIDSNHQSEYDELVDKIYLPF